MAQGAAKNKGKAKESGGRKKTGTMRKGRIAIAPKVTQKVREAAHKKVCRVLLFSTKLGLIVQQLSSKINDSIEKQMVAAASSGKLTIMKNKGDLEA
jgi:hypothetical protein